MNMHAVFGHIEDLIQAGHIDHDDVMWLIKKLEKINDDMAFKELQEVPDHLVSSHMMNKQKWLMNKIIRRVSEELQFADVIVLIKQLLNHTNEIYESRLMDNAGM